MSIFKNLFGNKKKEEKRVFENEIVDSKTIEEQLNNLETDKIIEDLENKSELKELENQKKLEELVTENKRVLNIKVSNNIKGVYPYIFQYYSDVKISIERLLSYYNILNINKIISEKDVIEMIIEIIRETQNCNNLKDFDTLFGKEKFIDFYEKYFRKINYGNSIITQSRREDVDRSIIRSAELAAENCLKYKWNSLSTMLIITDVNSSFSKNKELDAMNETLNDPLYNDLDRNYIKISYYLIIFSYIFGLVISFIRMLYLNDYVKKINDNEEFKIIVENSLIKNQFGVDKKIYKEFYINVFDTVLESYDLDLVALMYLRYKENNNWCEKMQSIFELLQIDCDKIVEDYVNSNSTKSIYEYSNDLLSTDLFKNLIIHPDSKSLAGLYTQYIIYKLVGIIDYDKWMYMIFDNNAFIEKVKIYRKKYELLNIDKSRINSIMKLDSMLSNVSNGEEFETFLKYLYELMGYMVELTPKTGDQGADLILQKNNEKEVIQAKFYNNPVGNSAVQEVVAATKYYHANKAIVVTNSTFTRAAIELAEANDVKLIDGNALNGCIKMLV